MKTRLFWTGLFVIGSGASPLAAQQDGCGLKEFATARAVGSYVDYKLTGNEAPGTLRMLLVSQEKRETGTMERIELTMNSPKMGRGAMVMQMLVPAWPVVQGDIGEMVVQAPGQPPMRMPPQMMAMMQQRGGRNAALEIKEMCKKATLVGTESVTVPAGSFSAKRFKNADGSEVWLSSDVGGWAVVKAVSPDGTMELAGQGTGGKTALTGEPTEMPGMPMMGGPRRPRP